MALEPPQGRRRIIAAAAGICAIAVLIACILIGGGAWRAWLAAAFLSVSVSVGALGLMMIMRNISGMWSREATPFLEAEIALAPLGALAMIPVLVALPEIYSWVGQPQSTPFREVWLTPTMFVLVTVSWFAIVFGLTAMLVGRPDAPRWVSCVGLLLFAIFGTFAATDWVQSLDPDLNSSGFGLYIICLQILLGLAGSMVFALSGAGDLPRRGIMSGLLLTVLLMWAYFAYMPYFIGWSGNVPSSAVWYLRRGRGVWGALAWLTAACRFIPMFLLLFTTVRNSKRWSFWVAFVVVAGGVPEVAWVVLPSPPHDAPATWSSAVLFIAAVASIAALWVALLGPAYAWADARGAAPAKRESRA